VGIEEVLGEKRQAIREIARRHGATAIRVFGSFARGEARPDSDVDLLVKLEKGRSLADLGGILMDLQDLLGRDVDVAEEGGLHPLLRERILSEAIPL